MTGRGMKEAFDVFDVGRMAVIQDPIGAVFALWQPRKHQGAGIVNLPNSFCWNELATSDTTKAGEFYTPRPVVRFMVKVTDPRLGETVLDPASGTGGFLVEAFNHLNQQVKTVRDRKVLQERSLTGCEPKSLPYLLCQMNLLLHGIDGGGRVSLTAGVRTRGLRNPSGQLR